MPALTEPPRPDAAAGTTARALAAALARLNPGQRAAATAGAGRHLVLAGPGTGKTTTLIARLAHLLAQGEAPSGLVAVTFTRAAAHEIATRLQAMIADGGGGHAGLSPPVTGTFHALAARWLGAHARRFGLSPGFQICDAGQQRRLFIELRLWWDEEGGNTLADAISSLKARLITADALAALIAAGQSPKNLDAPRLLSHYRAYQAALEARGWLDFDDLISRLVDGLERDPALLRVVAGGHRHLLVDEAQDLNPAQIRMMEALAGAHGNLWIVGDDDQSLYGFRAADPGFLVRYPRIHPDTTVHRLADSYRAGATLVTAAARLIAHNRQRHDKPLQPQSPVPGRLVLYAHEDPWREAQWLARAVVKCLEAGVSASQVAVLVRVGHVGQTLQPFLELAGVPLTLAGTSDLWGSLQARQLLALLLAAEGHEADARGLLGVTDARRRLLDRADTVGKVAPWPRRVGKAAGSVRVMQPRGEGSEGLAAQGRIDAVVKLAVHLGSLERLMAHVQAMRDARSPQARAPAAAGGADAAAVTLSTIHGAKGREWDMVFLPAWEDGLLPHSLADLEEERRIAFVATTRARRALTITWAERRGDQVQRPSPFLAELVGRRGDAVPVDWRGAGTLEGALARAPEMVAAALGRDAGSGAADGPDHERDVAQDRQARSRRAPAPPRATPLPPGLSPAPPRPQFTVKAAERYARNVAEGRAPCANIPWSDAEAEWLRQGFAQRLPLATLAAALERSAGAVAGTMAKLGLIEGRYPADAYQRLLEQEAGLTTPPALRAAKTPDPATLVPVERATPLPPDLPAPGPPPALQLPPGAAMRYARNVAEGRPPRSGTPWLPQEDAWLRAAFAARVPLPLLAAALERSESAVAAAFLRLELLAGATPAEAYGQLVAPPPPLADRP